MKVLVLRSFSFLTCRFFVLAYQYNWSVKTTEQIVNKLFSYLGLIYVPVERSLTPTASINEYIKSILPTLPPRKLRRLVSLCQVICQNPDYFEHIFTRFYKVPISDLQRYIDLDRKYFSSLPRNTRRKYFENVDMLAV